jgi:hypothetical protein
MSGFDSALPRTALFRCATLALLLAACDGANAPEKPRAWPPGTVLALDDVPISADEVDAIANIVARIEPQDSTTHVRRIALTNVVFPRVAGQALGGANREKSRALALECKRYLDEGQTPPAPLGGPELQSLEGRFSRVGLEAWQYGMEAPIGRWSDPIETVGGYQLVRIDERTKADTARDTSMKVSIYFFPYVEAPEVRTAVNAALDSARLHYVDESWRDVVPTSWQYRLRGGTP